MPVLSRLCWPGPKDIAMNKADMDTIFTRRIQMERQVLAHKVPTAAAKKARRLWHGWVSVMVSATFGNKVGL